MLELNQIANSYILKFSRKVNATITCLLYLQHVLI
jgi:hypothetical protein